MTVITIITVTCNNNNNNLSVLCYSRLVDMMGIWQVKKSCSDNPSFGDFEGTQYESESECKCLTCNQKPTGSQFSLLHEPN